MPLSGEHAANVGIDVFLTKPVRHQALIDCLTDLVQDERAESPDIQPASAPVSDSVPAAGGIGEVLLAEDNEINTLLASTLLEAVGYRVTCVVNGAQAVEAVGKQAFDLILMDLQMPVMDGLRATKLIRALGGAAAQTPIVAMTANAMTKDRDECLACGMNDFVSKPINPNQFLSVVARIIGGDEASDADQDDADETEFDVPLASEAEQG